jgi:hypothetical protein
MLNLFMLILLKIKKGLTEFDRANTNLNCIFFGNNEYKSMKTEQKKKN